MMVTDISEISKSRIRVEIDGEDSFVLYKGELRVYGIKEGENIPRESFEQLMCEVLPKRARLRAMNLLKGRSYTSFQLMDKLTTGGYSEKQAREAVDYVASFGYIDDRQYAKDFIEYNKERKSKQRILSDLQQKGVPRPLLEEVWEETVGENMAELEMEQIRGWLQKKHFDARQGSPADIKKMAGFLYRKGFSFDSIRSVLSLDITSI